MLAWVPSATPQDETKERVFGASDVYIVSWECGYLNERDGLVLPCDLVVIDGQEQLDYAKREWGLADFEPLGAMVGERPLESNFYLLSYSSRPTGNPRVSGVLVGHDTIFFLWDKNCPALSADLSRDACGVIYLAAVPRTYADGRAFRYVIYPGESDSEVLS